MYHEKQNFNRLKTPEKPTGNKQTRKNLQRIHACDKKQTNKQVAKIRDSCPISLREAMSASSLTSFVAGAIMAEFQQIYILTFTSTIKMSLNIL